MSALLMGSKDKYLGVDLKIGARHTVSEHSRVVVVLGLMELQWNQRHEGWCWAVDGVLKRLHTG